MKNSKKGISLIVLIITIIVIVILATAILVSVINNNPISEANKARYESDRDNMQAVFTNTVGKIMAENQGTVNVTAGQINTEIKDVNEATGEVAYTVDNATVAANASGKIVFDKGTNDATTYYTGKKLPIYQAGETKWYVDSEGVLSLKVAGVKYGKINYSHKEVVEEVGSWTKVQDQGYPFERMSTDENDANYYVWKSSNTGIDDSRSITMFSTEVAEEISYTFNWSISSEENDYMAIIFVDGNGEEYEFAMEISGVQSGTETVTLTPGENQIMVGYLKDTSVNGNDDCVTLTLKDVENSKCQNKETNEIQNHIYDDGEITKKETCTEDGVKTYTCLNCGKEKNEIIKKYHMNNNQDAKCDICGESVSGLYKPDGSFISYEELINTEISIYNHGLKYSTILVERGNRLSSFYHHYVGGGETNVSSSYLDGRLIIPDNINILGENLFNKCSKLTSIYIPSSVNKFEANVFSNSSIVEIDYGGTIAEWNAIEKASDYITNSSSITVHCTDGDTVIASTN